MGRRQKTTTSQRELVTFEALEGRHGGRGIFGLEDAADEVARQAKLRSLADQIAAYDRGYEGGQRRCPRCGQWQQYKGERPRKLSFDCGTLTVARAYYACASCHMTSYPLDEQLGLVEGKEQGRLREELALLAVLAPYHQAPQVCQTLVGAEYHASSLRRVALREAQHLAASGHRHTLPRRAQERRYLQVDGHLCPTREARQSPEDQGYREAKVVLAFAERDVAEVSKGRHEILAKVLRAKITDSEEFRAIFQEVYRRAQGQQAAELIVLADGARWIWNLVEELVPQALQILGFSHAKPYLWEAAKLIHGEGAAFLAPWVKERGSLLLDDKAEQVITHLEHLLDLAPALAPILHYFQHNAGRMRYGRIAPGGSLLAREPSRVPASSLPPPALKGLVCAGTCRI